MSNLLKARGNASITAAPQTAVTSEDVMELPLLSSNVPAESFPRSSSPVQNTPIAAIQSPRHTSPSDRRLQTAFEANSIFEPSDPRSSNTINSILESTSQVSVQDDPDNATLPKQRLPLQQSLGVFSIAIMFGGSLLILVAVSFLIFLWAGRGPVEGGTKAPPAWRYIMLRGWATQAVTLTALLLRVISAAQAGLCTSMVAALLLELRGIPISKVVHLSVTRSVSTGPMEFLYASRKIQRLALKPEVLLLFILAFTAFGIQFSSTILLSDFGPSRLVRDANETLMNVAMSPSTNSQKPGSLSTFGSPDTSSILFGEVDSRVDPSPTEYGVSDTGTKRRAFLPFLKEARIDLQYFSGAAFSSVSRVTCIRPSMEARLSFTPNGYPLLQGSINYNRSLEDAGQLPIQRCYTAPGNNVFCLPTTFNCTLPGSYDSVPNPQWTTALCHLEINPSDVRPGWDGQGSPLVFTSGSWPHLVFTTNMLSSDWQQIGPSTLNKSTSVNGEWVTNEIGLGRLLNTTFCLSVIYGTVASLTMTGNLNQTEESLQFNTTTSSPKVETLQTLFGADRMHKSPAERGILSILDNIQDPALPPSFNINRTSVQDIVDYSSIVFGEGAAAGVFDNTGASVSLCDHCDLLGFSVPDDVATLFQNIINTTGRAAVAIDTYLAILSRWWYYYLFPRFDVPGHVNVIFVAEVVLPLRWRGIIAVFVLVGVNTVVMWIIAALYVRRTRFSLAGNYWHAVAQLISKETGPLLDKSSEMKDEDLKEQLDLESEDFLVKIARSPHDGHVTVVRVDE
ncbi:hypothetical protein F5Y08DRAFT_348457 [Xylaria arbuscula]|nr:hypothetical protein F5Y08DRAFT_348457 [Xylaria arbuscula]